MAYNFEKLEELLKEKGVSVKEIEEMVNPLRSMAQKRKYGLVWEEQEEDIEKSLKDRYTVLHEVTEREIKLDEGGRTHSLIEGDNLEALTFLKNSGKKVDVIYIDPPYNTTNRDFIYNDDYVDKEDAWRHSKWLSFMNKRLVLARELLTDDGVIFISIDDHEMAQLRLLGDQIFGEKNFVENFMWLHGKGKKTKQSRTLQQYTLCYAKNRAVLPNWKELSYTNYNFSNPDNDPKGKWFSGSISFNESRSNPKHRNFYQIQSPSGKVWERQWMVSESEMALLIRAEDIYFGEAPFYDKTPRLKVRPSEIEIIPNNIIAEKGTTRSAQKELHTIFGEDIFDYPKPVTLIKHLIEITNKRRDITILDFFAGSGTTAHAVLELNREDGGNRQVILCTNNENNIAEEVTYERIKRVMEGYSTPKGKSVEGIPGNLRYFKVDSVDADEDIYTLEDNLLEVVVPFIQYKEDAWNITTGKPGFTYLDDRVTIYNDPYHLDEDFLDHIKGSVFYIYDGWMDYLDIEELKDIRVVPIPKEFFKLFR